MRRLQPILIAEFKNATWKCQAIYVLSEKEDYVSWYVGKSIRIPMTCGDERVVCTYDTNNEYHCGEASKIIQRAVEDRPVSSDILVTASCTLFESV